jgi:hypothetical protein
LAIASALGLSIAVPTACAEDVPDHLTLLETLGHEAAGEMLDQLDLPAGATIHLVPETAHPANWLMSRILEQALVARGYRVLSPAFGKDGSDALASAPGAEPTPGGPKPQPGMKKTGNGQTGAGTQTEDDDATSGAQGPESAGEGTGTGAGGSSDDATSGPSGSGAGAPGDSAGVSQEARPAETEPEEVAPVETGAVTTPPEAGGVEGAFKLMLPEAGEVLSFRIVECGISYPWVKRSLLIGPQRYGRIAAVRVWGSHLQEPGNCVAGSARGERIQIDSFPGWARSALEGQSYPFPLKTPEPSSLKAVVEPAVVAGIVAGLIYLFYQNQK